MTISFSDTAVDYDPVSNTGCQFKNCDFKDFSTVGIFLDRTDLKIDYCNFDSISYPIQANSDSLKLWVSNSTFQGNGFGFVIYGLHQHTYLSFTHCVVYNFGYIMLAENNIIQYCCFYGSRYYPSISNYGVTKTALISCNYFKKGSYAYAPAIDLSSVNYSGCHLIIENNEFDSMTVFFKMPCYYYATDTIEINYNDFLHYAVKAVQYANCFNGNGTYHLADFTSNYWNTTDTSLIKAAIYDNRNDANVPFLVDYSSYQSSPVSYCWPLTPGDAQQKQNSTGIKSNKIDTSHLALFPNPAGNLINIESDLYGSFSLKLTDISGRTVLSKVVNINKATIDLSSLKAGIYIAEISNALGEKYQVKMVHY